MRICVLGTGSIGSLILGALCSTEHDLVAVSRGETAMRLSTEGLVIHRHDGPIDMIPPTRFTVIDTDVQETLQGNVENSDFAIICGKSGDTYDLARFSSKLLSTKGIALTVQNGLGNYEAIREILGSHRSMGGSTTHGAWRDQDGAVHWEGFGEMAIGSGESDPREDELSILSALVSAGLNPRWTVKLQTTIWTKAMINVAINPICAIAGITNGDIESNPKLLSLSFEAANEVASVGHAHGVDMSALDIEEIVLGVIRSTSENKCSMLQDVMAGRPTEIDQLCGRVTEIAETHGIPAPINTTLLALIKGIEATNR